MHKSELSFLSSAPCTSVHVLSNLCPGDYGVNEGKKKNPELGGSIKTGQQLQRNYGIKQMELGHSCGLPPSASAGGRKVKF